MKRLFVRGGALVAAMALAFAITPVAVANEVSVGSIDEGECRNPSVAWNVDVSGGGALVYAEVDPGRICLAT